MRRRALLSSLPAVGGLAIAGCLDRASSALHREPEVRELDPHTTHPTQSWAFEDSGGAVIRPHEAAELVAIGSSDDAHWVIVAAESEDPVATSITVGPVDGDLLYEETFELSNERYFGVRFEYVQAHEVTVETDRHERTVEVGEHWIDCNDSTQSVLLATDGTVRISTASTDVAC